MLLHVSMQQIDSLLIGSANFLHTHTARHVHALEKSRPDTLECHAATHLTVSCGDKLKEKSVVAEEAAASSVCWDMSVTLLQNPAHMSVNRCTGVATRVVSLQFCSSRCDGGGTFSTPVVRSFEKTDAA